MHNTSHITSSERSAGRASADPSAPARFTSPDTVCYNGEELASALAHVCRLSNDISDQMVSTVTSASVQAKRLEAGSLRRFELEQKEMERESRQFRHDLAAHRVDANVGQLSDIFNSHRQMSCINHEARLRRLQHENIFFFQVNEQRRHSLSSLSASSREVGLQATTLHRISDAQHQATLNVLQLTESIARDRRLDALARSESAQAILLGKRRLSIQRKEAVDVSVHRQQSLRCERLRARAQDNREAELRATSDEQFALTERASRGAKERALEIERRDRERQHRLRQNEQDFQQTMQMVETCASVGQAVSSNFGRKGR